MDQHHKNVKLVQEAVERKCAGLLPDPFLAQRVLNAAEKNGKTRERKPFSVGLAFALVLMTVLTVAVSLNRVPESVPPQVVAASLPDGDEPGFTAISAASQPKTASGHTCEWDLHDTHRDSYQYYNATHDILCVEFINVCRICGRTGELVYTPDIGDKLTEHQWVMRDYHHAGTDLHLFYQECSLCHSRWDLLELACSGDRGMHIDPTYYTNPDWRQRVLDTGAAFVPSGR